MNIEITAALPEQQAVLRSLAQLYCHDLSEFTGDDVDARGLFGHPDLGTETYLSEKNKHSFLIQTDRKIAGFAVVERTEKETGPSENIMAYFFILRKYRRKGIGTEAVRQIFNIFSGKWGIGYVEKNEPAQLFWHKVINQLR